MYSIVKCLANKHLHILHIICVVYVLTYGSSGVQLGIRRHRSLMMRMMMTQDCRLAALACARTAV